MERQIKIRGKAYKMTESESEAYFETRPRGSQLGAWASDQSSEIESREILDQKLRELELQFDGKMIPKPQHWGGFEVEPLEFEFWQGRPNRLHDRIRYRKEEHVWIKNRLQP
jgi:pyridoxamine 5'-phosphate oxidase